MRHDPRHDSTPAATERCRLAGAVVFTLLSLLGRAGADEPPPLPPFDPPPGESLPFAPLPTDGSPTAADGPLPAADTPAVAPLPALPLPEGAAGAGSEGPPGRSPTIPAAPPEVFPPGAGRAADGTLSVLAMPTDLPAAPPLRPAAVDGGGSPLPPPTTKVAAALAARALALPPQPGSAADPGMTRPLPLLEALERSGDRTRRLWITQAYWKLAAAAARYRFALDAEERLTLVAPGSGGDDVPLLELAIAEARGEAASAGVDLVAAQQELIDLVRLPPVEPAPWPADRPLTAAYQTHFETIFATRPATGRIRAIHRQLPLAHRAIEARAEAAAAAEARFQSTEALHAQGKKPIGAVLAAHETIREQETAFVQAVQGYNQAIAEYVMAVADLSVPDERFATMLIGQPLPWRQQTPPDRVVPVSASGVPGGTPTAAPPGLLPAPPGFLPAPPAATGPGGAPFPPAAFPVGG